MNTEPRKIRAAHERTKIFILIINLAFCFAFVQAQPEHVLQKEKLTRGVVALPMENGGQFVSWRFLVSDPLTTTFDVLRDGNIIARDIANRTNFADAQGTSGSMYQVVAKSYGNAIDTTDIATPWPDYYKNIKLKRPAGGVYPFRERTYDEEGNITGWTEYIDTPYSYHPYECSIGDVDDDGVYELFVEWNPTNSQDNSQLYGKTGNVFIDCYRMDGTMLWRVDLGVNIRAGEHYTQFLVYDFDGNGRAEMICKTAPGSIDGQGSYVNQASAEDEIRSADNNKDWRNETGKVLGGQEYLTVFDGLTGKALNTIFYNPNRNARYGGDAIGTFDWDDRTSVDDATYGNRGERYLAAVAYLDGTDNKPSAVMCRGYYTYSFLWAVDFNGEKLITKWFHASRSKNKVERTDANGCVETRMYNSNTFGIGDSYTAYGQGNHQIAVADVDDDGCDEIIYGAAAIDHDGWLMYSTGLGHGDRLHVGDLMPDRPGLEVFRCIETLPAGCEIHDARTGEKLYYRTSVGDTGACIAADIDSQHRGFEFWASDNRTVLNSKLEIISENSPNYHGFRIFWDGDLQDELFYRGGLNKWNGDGVTRLYLNKKNFYDLGNSGYASVGGASLQADLFGDWREELVCWNQNDSASVNIFTTNIPSKYRVPTLMQDHYYRLAIVRQNVCYNQMPMLGYYLPDADYSYSGDIQDEAEPDLTNHVLQTELDFENVQDAYITTAYPNEQKGTAWESGNRKQQKLYNTVTPETMHDVLAFQGVYSGSNTKGWWINRNAGGLVTENATRSAAILGLKKGDIVTIESTNHVVGTLTLTDGEGNPDGNFVFEQSNDGTKYYCTMTDDGQIGFCGVRYYTGAIKNIKIYTLKTNGIEDAFHADMNKTTYFSVSGKSSDFPHKGFNIVKSIGDDGKVRVRKIIIPFYH